MKKSLTLLLFSLGAFLLLTGAGKARFEHKHTETFKVYGNCGMCVERIQDAALDSKYVESAEWNIDTQLLTVTYDEDRITLQQIHENIAAVGHDTDKVRAPDKKYRKLPECCKYKRPN